MASLAAGHLIDRICAAALHAGRQRRRHHGDDDQQRGERAAPTSHREHCLSGCEACQLRGRSREVIVAFFPESAALSDVSVHIGTPRPRAAATDQLKARSANDVLYR